MTYLIQTRTPGHAYRTVAKEPDVVRARWVCEQYLTPYGNTSVRLVDPDGEVIVRWVPKSSTRRTHPGVGY